MKNEKKKRFYFIVCQSYEILLACCNGGIGGVFKAHCPSDGFLSHNCKPK